MFLFLIILYNKDTILLIGLNIRTVIEALTLVILKKNIFSFSLMAFRQLELHSYINVGFLEPVLFFFIKLRHTRDFKSSNLKKEEQ